MFEDFCNKYPDIKVSYIYWKLINRMNISFAKLGKEQCKECIIYESHSERGLASLQGARYTIEKLLNQVECQMDVCSKCKMFNSHKLNAEIARKEYEKDNKSNNDGVHMSIDMQKVIMLPSIPGVKTVVFAKRLVVFHMTFVLLDDGTESLFGIIWNESISVRWDEDVKCTYVKLIVNCKRDERFFNFCAVNCSAQNKNWTLHNIVPNC